MGRHVVVASLGTKKMAVDTILKQRVQDELDWLPNIDAANIGVSVSGGVVSLTGHVPSYPQKIAVDDAVKKIKGVRGIAEEIAVRPSGDIGVSDDEVTKRVVNLLDWDASVPKGAVEAQVANGFVTLIGEVDWQYQRFAAEHGVRNLSGVRALFNQVTVKPHVQPEDIKRRIESALDRQADLDSERIHVTVDGAKVRLDGKVRAWFERDVIERAAWAAPGVQAVEDHVSIAP